MNTLHPWPLPPIALTMGEPAGIGGEIALKAWHDHRTGLPPFFLVDDPARLSSLAARLSLPIAIQAISEPEGAAAIFADSLPVLPVELAAPPEPGRLDPANASAVRQAIEMAVEFAVAGRAAAVVTNPINKLALYRDGFEYPGHTEFLAALAGSAAEPVMMLASPLLRVVPVTRHVSLREALHRLDETLIVDTAETTMDALREDFGIAEPVLAVAGLNPHAGEGGSMGTEEKDILGPAMSTLRDRGHRLLGPMPPDTMFHPEARAGYDAALCMYHDQGLIPIKTIDFHGAVNVTLGLPFVRTSPDHGTALDIAGTGQAREDSLVAALALAAEMAVHRHGGADAPQRVSGGR